MPHARLLWPWTCLLFNRKHGDLKFECRLPERPHWLIGDFRTRAARSRQCCAQKKRNEKRNEKLNGEDEMSVESHVG
jgi:hypothetical protein